MRKEQNKSAQTGVVSKEALETISKRLGMDPPATSSTELFDYVQKLDITVDPSRHLTDEEVQETLKKLSEEETSK